MSRDLSAFLAQNVKRVENTLYPATNRIVDENGKPILWEICCIKKRVHDNSCGSRQEGAVHAGV